MSKTVPVRDKKSGQFAGSVGAGKSGISVPAPNVPATVAEVEAANVARARLEATFISVADASTPLRTEDMNRALIGLNLLSAKIYGNDLAGRKIFAMKQFGAISNRWMAYLRESFGSNLNDAQHATTMSTALTSVKESGTGFILTGLEEFPVKTDFTKTQKRYQWLASYASRIVDGEK